MAFGTAKEVSKNIAKKIVINNFFISFPHFLDIINENLSTKMWTFIVLIYLFLIQFPCSQSRS